MNKSVIALLEAHPGHGCGIDDLAIWALDISLYIPELIDTVKGGWISVEKELLKEIEDYLSKCASINIERHNDGYDHVAFMLADDFQRLHYLLQKADEVLRKLPNPPGDKCEHGRGLTEYCEPCGRINST